MAPQWTPSGQHTLILLKRFSQKKLRLDKRHTALLAPACFILALGALALEHFSFSPVSPWFITPLLIPVLARLSLPHAALALMAAVLGDALAHLVFMAPQAAWSPVLANAFGLLCGALWWRHRSHGGIDSERFLKDLAVGALVVPLFSALPTALAAFPTGQAALSAGAVRYLSGALGMLLLLPLMFLVDQKRLTGLFEHRRKSGLVALAGVVVGIDALLLWLDPAQMLVHGILLSGIALLTGAFYTTLVATLTTLVVLICVTLRPSALPGLPVGAVIYQFLLAFSMLPAIAYTLVLHARQVAHRRLSRHRRIWRDALEGSGQGVWEIDLVSRRMSPSLEARRLMGRDKKSRFFAMEEWRSLIHEEDRDAVIACLEAHIADKSSDYFAEYRLRQPDGTFRWYQSRGRVMYRDGAERPTRMLGTLIDIDQRRRAELERTRLAQALLDEKERWRVTLASIGEAVIVTDCGGSITFMNSAAERLTGWAADEARWVACNRVFDLRRADGAPCDPVRSCLAHDGVESVGEEITLCNRAGRNVEIYATVAPVRESEERLTGAVVVFRDLTRSRELQRRLNFSLNHDALTGYYNRVWFEHEVVRAIEAAARGESAVLGVINMDYFRIVNDAAGHLAGDALLVEVSCLIGRHLARGDILARLGSDEFGLLLCHCELDEAHQRVESLLAAISALHFRWEGRLYDVSASGGLAVISGDTPDFGTLMSRADIGCYTAKQQGRNRVNIYQSGQQGVEHLHREIFVAAGLREAIENDRFRLYGQRIVALESPHQSGYYEVLIKMRDARGELIEPGVFIPAAERYGLMPALDRWILENVLIHQGEAISALPDGGAISINLSASSLGDERFLPWLLERLARTPIKHSSLLFEITETALMGHLSRAGEVIETLRLLGCRVALDDFGSGFSSFGYLRSFTVDVVKIDGSFIRHINDNRLDQVIVESINQVVHRLGALTVAEFVENAETLERLRAIGLDYAQGHYIHRPQPLEALYR